MYFKCAKHTSLIFFLNSYNKVLSWVVLTFILVCHTLVLPLSLFHLPNIRLLTHLFSTTVSKIKIQIYIDCKGKNWWHSAHVCIPASTTQIPIEHIYPCSNPVSRRPLPTILISVKHRLVSPVLELHVKWNHTVSSLLSAAFAPT